MSPSPYYRDEMVTLYHGNCLEIAAWLAADVLVTDPPYGMDYNSGWVKGREDRPISGDKTTQARDTALERWGTRPAIVFGTWRVPKPSGVRQTGIWDKGDDPGMGDLSIPWGSSFEEFYILGSGFVGKRGGAVIRMNKPPVSNRPDHPTPKPVGLMERLIVKTVGTVADPFAGSGSTLLAARNLGRKAIGVELEERYCELIASRLAQGAFDFGEAA
ncbi:DNA-methyltransferase [Nocardia sp. NPDC057455]|uniref:DNA-methyltransferase n=1 Tax=Nocardia sp. NPDC057455 TaxID=3346138 RepID=UPI00366CFEF1